METDPKTGVAGVAPANLGEILRFAHIPLPFGT
jgi:hypothetical protein